MNQFKEISTLQYMGSKSRIISHICAPIIHNARINRVVDLFAGTGSVGYALKDYKNVISNDIEHYAYVLNKAILNGCSFSEAAAQDFFTDANECYLKLTLHVKKAIEAEKSFFVSEPDFIAYKEFCDNTPSISSIATSDLRLQKISKLACQIIPGQKQDEGIPCLFLTYYSNTYFGIAQCCQIDALRKAIDNIKDKDIQNVLLAVLMSVMSATASTTTHFAQYLKVKNATTCKNLIEKRKFDIIEGVERLLLEFRNANLCEASAVKSNCYNMDYMDCLNSIDLDSQTLVYADPPYFKEHYSRYYHVLNTLCLYDYPKISVNPQTHENSVGRYREDRSVSDFGKKSMALSAFERLINKCSDAGAWLTISYSDNSIVSISDLENLAHLKYDVLVKKIELNHSKQGRSSTTKVDEYIFICRPKTMVTSVEEKLSVIKELKPIVDNPAGFMHNYMARKPYNVVSELIKRFSPDNGCVYDPMFGSGTIIVEASKLGRRAIGTDINLIAHKLCQASLTGWNLDKINNLLDSFCIEIKNMCSELYSFEENGEIRIIERCHFNQEDATLIPVTYWYKTVKNGKLTGRKKCNKSVCFDDTYFSFDGYEITNIHDSTLIPNSRIAIGKGDTVFKYFCKRNLVAMDRILGCLKTKEGSYGYALLELLVSSAINLIKLSDKKASSQMPYWLPKKDVTSRNAVMVIEQKAKAFKKGLLYLNENCKTFASEDDGVSDIVLKNIPAQLTSKNILPDNSVDLILTDPPYTDQVPYLEYSQLWYKVMGWSGFDDKTLESELVVSDAQSRDKDINNFNTIFSEIIGRISPALKINGYFIMFYHSFDLTSWSSILTLMQDNGLCYCGQMPSAAPRKSFKTIMTPNNTLDGNYIILFQKKEAKDKAIFRGTIKDAEKLAVECARRIISQNSAVTSQELYDCGMLKDSFEFGYLPTLATKYTSFIDVIYNDFFYTDGLWREKPCIGY